MKLGIIVGSHRVGSQSTKVAKYVKASIQRQLPGVDTYVFDLAGNPLPLWDQSVWADSPEWKKIWGPISQELRTCDGFVVVSPEWSGMVPPGLKNFFLLTGSADIGHKPGFIVGVSSTLASGSYPIVELRMSSYKNTRINWMPEHAVVRDVEKVMNTESPVSENDKFIRDRVDYGLRLLAEYAKALRLVRESGVIDHKNFTNGM